jgi:hypothetical protein
MWKLGLRAQFPEKEYINGIVVAVWERGSIVVCLLYIFELKTFLVVSKNNINMITHGSFILHPL